MIGPLSEIDIAPFFPDLNTARHRLGSSRPLIRMPPPSPKEPINKTFWREAKENYSKVQLAVRPTACKWLPSKQLLITAEIVCNDAPIEVVWRGFEMIRMQIVVHASTAGATPLVSLLPLALDVLHPGQSHMFEFVVELGELDGHSLEVETSLKIPNLPGLTTPHTRFSVQPGTLETVLIEPLTQPGSQCPAL
jgi:hypothetical protein